MSLTQVTTENQQYDRQSELKSFDEAKLGVKGLIDSGISKVPRMFVNTLEHNRPDDSAPENPELPKQLQLSIPTIDLEGIENDLEKLKKVVEEIGDACVNWGFFQVVNHGISKETMDDVVDGVRRFHEQDNEAKKQYYTREYAGKKCVYFSNYYLYTGPVTNWRDTITLFMAPDPPQPEELPTVCRDILLEYSKQVANLSHTLFELISRALGLSPNHLKDMDCGENMMMLGHYYPPCPEPDVAIGFGKHADNDVLTILIQDQVGGLQVWHENTWVDVPHVPGAFVINTGDLLQDCLLIFIVVTSLLGSNHGLRVHKFVNNSPDFNVLDYGATGDGVHDDTKAISQAWLKVCTASGDTPTLVFPQGKTFLLKPISFKGPCKSSSIHVEIQGNIVAPNSTGEWGECEGNNWMNFADVENLIIDGQGEIDGRGSIWWSNKNANLATINVASSCYRPSALSFENCEGLQLNGLTHKNSPGSHIRMGGCNNSTISNVNIVAPEDSPNTDGIDISSTNNLNIRDSIIGTGDDCIAIGSDTQWINITNITCGPGHGISVGSLGENGSQAKVENIHVRNCSFNKTQNGARIKTWQGGSGYARNITYDGITLTGVNNPIIIDQYYCDTEGHNCPPQSSAVAVLDVTFSGFQGTSSSKAAITLNCSQATPCTGIVLQSIGLAPSNPDTGATSFCEHADVQANTVVPPVNCTN